jgi:two-component system nitrate/nitrite response regulator NarL
MESTARDHLQPGTRLLGAAAGGPCHSPERPPISVLVADDHPILREHLGRMIDADHRLVLAALAEDGLEALRLSDELRPDAIVLDVDMPNLDGAGVLRGLRAAETTIRVLLFTGHAEPGPLREAMRLQPDSLLYKGDGGFAICDEIVAMVREEPSAGRLRREGAQAAARNGPTLTERERVVLAFAAQGRSVADLAARLNVSQRTAKARRHDLCKRFGVDSILGVIATAMRMGLLD